MDEFEQYRRKPIINTDQVPDDFDQYRSQPKQKTFGQRHPILLGLGQAGEDFLKGQFEGMAGGELDVPSQWKPERVRNQPEKVSPSFNLEQYIDHEDKGKFDVARYAPAIGTALLQGGRGLAHSAKGFTNKSIANEILKDYRANKRHLNKEYNAFYESAAKSGVDKVPLNFQLKDFQDLDYLTNILSPKQESQLVDLLQDTSLRNVTGFNTTLKNLIRKLGHKREIGKLEGIEPKALKAAEKLQEKFDENIHNAFTKKGPSNLPEKLKQTNQKYAQMVGPYLDSDAIRKANIKAGKKGSIDPRRIPEKISKQTGDPFMAHIRGDPMTGEMINPYLHGKYSELELNRALAGPVNAASLATAPATALLRALLGGR